MITRLWVRVWNFLGGQGVVLQLRDHAGGLGCLRRQRYLYADHNSPLSSMTLRKEGHRDTLHIYPEGLYQWGKSLHLAPFGGLMAPVSCVAKNWDFRRNSS